MDMGNGCASCGMSDDCKMGCWAMGELGRMYATQSRQDRVARVRALRRLIGVQDAQPDVDLRRLGERVLASAPELADSPARDMWAVGYVNSLERKGGEMPKMADCRKVPVTYRAWLPYDFVITVYESNCGYLSEAQMEILMIHELLHVGTSMQGRPKLMKHTVQDFRVILERRGIGWADFGGVSEDGEDDEA